MSRPTNEDVQNWGTVDAATLERKKRLLAEITLRLDLLSMPFARSNEMGDLLLALEAAAAAARRESEDEYVEVLDLATGLLGLLRYGPLPAPRARAVKAQLSAVRKSPVVQASSPDRMSTSEAITFLCELVLVLLHDEPLRKVGRFIVCSECHEQFDEGSMVCWTQRISHFEPGPLQHPACAKKTRAGRMGRCFSRFLFAVSMNPGVSRLLPVGLWNDEGDLCDEGVLGRLTGTFSDLLVSKGVIGGKVSDPMAVVDTFVEKGLEALGATEVGAHNVLASWRMRDIREMKKEEGDPKP